MLQKKYLQHGNNNRTSIHAIFMRKFRAAMRSLPATASVDDSGITMSGDGYRL